MMMELSTSPVVFVDVKRYSSNDPVISRVMDQIINGESKYKGDNPEIERYMRHYYEFSVEDCTLLRGNRVVIPNELRETILQELHEAHPGIVRMKALARSYVWWPGIDNVIESVAKRMCTLPASSEYAACCPNSSLGKSRKALDQITHRFRWTFFREVVLDCCRFVQ